MKLINANYFGPQHYALSIVEYPPYAVTVQMVRYGYETAHTVYDVCIPERPVGQDKLTRWYKTNGVSSAEPAPVHKAIEKHFNL